MSRRRAAAAAILLLAAAGYGAYRFHGMGNHRAADAIAAKARMAAWPGPRVATAFALAAPGAQQVYLAGDMTGWEDNWIAMQRGSDGVWRISVQLPSGQWLYKFIVDGKWISDPANPLSDDDGRGGRHSFVLAGDGEWKVPAGAPRGVVKTFTAPSGTLTNLYLPPGYAAGKPYPLLVLLHGSSADANQWYRTGVVDRFMDGMIARGRIRPFIIVMPTSGDDYTGASEKEIIQQLLPQLQRDYGVRLRPVDTAVAGMSMGGFGAFYLAQRHPDLFGLAIPVSGAFRPRYLDSLPRPLKIPFQLQILCGSDDFLLSGNRALRDRLTADGAKFSYQESNGAHEWHYWNAQLPAVLTTADQYFQTAPK